MQQSSATPRCRDWVAEDCCILSLLLAVPSRLYSFWHGVIPTSYFIFILVLFSLDCSYVARGEMILPAVGSSYTYSVHAHARELKRLILLVGTRVRVIQEVLISLPLS